MNTDLIDQTNLAVPLDSTTKYTKIRRDREKKTAQ